MIFTSVILADVHFGAIPARKLYNELNEEFLKFIKNKYIDMIVIAGDFYNSIISLNSQSALLSFKFIKKMVEICEENGIKYVRLIEGTLSHDNFQIENFKMHENNKSVDFKVITETTSEILPNGIKILYLPEEYSKTMDDYKEYLDVSKKYYDFIFGHGMFKETSFGSEDDSESQIPTTVIWDSKLLGSLCAGPIFFGHIHTPQVIRKNIYYVGSFSRWCYGQEEDKGFVVCVYDTDSHKYLVEHVVNELADKYDTATIYLDQYTGTMEELVVMCRKLKENNLRIQLILESNDEKLTPIVSFLRTFYTGKQGYKLQVLDKREKIETERKERELQERNTDFNFIFDSSVPMKSKIHQFIKKKYSQDVSEEFIKEILFL